MLDYEYFVFFDSDEVRKNITDEEINEGGRWLQEMIRFILKKYIGGPIHYNDKFDVIVTDRFITEDIIKKLYEEKKIELKHKSHNIHRNLVNSYEYLINIGNTLEAKDILNIIEKLQKN